jgi:hypothetical protein
MKSLFIEWARHPSNVLNTLSFIIIFTIGYFFSVWVAIPMFILLLVSMSGPILG